MKKYLVSVWTTGRTRYKTTFIKFNNWYTLNCIYCGITIPASTSKAHVNPAASDIENQTDKS